MEAKLAPFPIVGIGASAGGIQALEVFFQALPPDCGLAIVIVTHLSPDRESLLHTVVGRFTDLPVEVAHDGMEVKRDRVYVLPADAILGIRNGHLEVTKPNRTRRERNPIDIFLAALAKDQGEYAIGILLSGSGHDGTLGMKAIKEHGGLTLAQVSDHTAPLHAEMPDSAIRSRLIDLPIPVQEMPAKLIRYVRNFYVLDELGASAGHGGREEADDIQGIAQSEAQRTVWEAIYTILRNQTGHDFSGYKSRTFSRRVRRRMQVVQAETLEAYLERLRGDAAEVTMLFRDLLIGVTAFFRDVEAFAAVQRQVIPRLFEGRTAEDAVRVWVPGCATGEEVYSIAILILEHMDGLPAKPQVQLFATDIDEAALAVARTARYPESMLEGISPERIERFFRMEGASTILAKEVRDLVILSPHSIIRDPPFSRIDMISCRNLLIYFGADVQDQVIPIFHYALKPGGYLFLGTSESISRHNDLFIAIDKKHRLFQSREHGAEPVRLPQLVRGGRRPAVFVDAPPPRVGPVGPSLRQAVEANVLERFAPAHVVVTAEGDVVYYSSRTGKYLEAPAGAPSRHLLMLARAGLRLDLRSALKDAVENQHTVHRTSIEIGTEDGRVQMVSLAVEPLLQRDAIEPLFLVIFIDQGPALSREEADARGHHSPDIGVLQLEHELRDTRERLQSVIEEYETTLEELKASNEELFSVNEEMQSTNEEMEASKEELQSLNEELHTVNFELNDKVDELDRANGDLSNLFESTRIATIFLDRDLVIRNFTPAVARIFNLRPGDRGRPLTDLANRLDYPDLRNDILAVFETGETVEKRVQGSAEREYFLARLIPYKYADERIHGVVATFIDVSGMVHSEEQRDLLIAELNHRVKNMLMVVTGIAQQTIRLAASPQEFYDAFMGRLQAMSRAYELLAHNNWEKIGLHELAAQELEPFRLQGRERVKLEGEAVPLTPRLALALGLILHELATNAAKYGALSTTEGNVTLAWSVNSRDAAGSMLRIAWRETGGPQPRLPMKRGFGLKLIEREAQAHQSGTAKIDFAPTGLSVDLSMLLAE